MVESSKIDSPCVRNCCLDKEDICLGCGRSINEILAWCDASDSQKREILDNAKHRQKARNKLKL